MIRSHPYVPAWSGTSVSTPASFCVGRRKRLEFHPLIDVKTFEDLLNDPVNEPT